MKLCINNEAMSMTEYSLIHFELEAAGAVFKQHTLDGVFQYYYREISDDVGNYFIMKYPLCLSKVL